MDKYMFQNILGQGTYGVTWLAKDSVGQQVAIKKLKVPDYLSLQEDLIIELAALKSILPTCEPYAVCIKDWSINMEDGAQIVMDYVDGVSVNKLITGLQLPLLTRQNDERIVYDLINGIKHIHSTGVVHQDIKDENLMWDMNLKIFRFIDFGLSCVKINSTVNTSRRNWPCGTIGTYYTASPDMAAIRGKNRTISWEQLQAHDYWSIGIVLLRWFTYNGSYYYYSDLLHNYYKRPPFNRLLSRSKFAPVYYEFSEDLLQHEINKIPNLMARQVVEKLLIKDWKKRFAEF
jgi:serine/threonine protein kinase